MAFVTTSMASMNTKTNSLQSNNLNFEDFIDKFPTNGNAMDESKNVAEIAFLKKLKEMEGMHPPKCFDLIHLLMIINRIRNGIEVQNKAREYGCLKELSEKLCDYLDENQSDIMTDFIITALVASFKQPWNQDNQTYVGANIPIVIDYFNRILNSEDIPDDLNLWRFLQCLIRGNEDNQNYFMEHGGLNTIFRTLNLVLLKNDNNEAILIKIMQILLNLILQRDFVQKLMDLNFDVYLGIKLLRIENKKVTRYTFQLLNVLHLWKNRLPLKSPNLNVILQRKKFHKREVRQKEKQLKRLIEIPKTRVTSENRHIKPKNRKNLIQKCFSYIYEKAS